MSTKLQEKKFMRRYVSIPFKSGLYVYTHETIDDFKESSQSLLNQGCMSTQMHKQYIWQYASQSLLNQGCMSTKSIVRFNDRN